MLVSKDDYCSAIVVFFFSKRVAHNMQYRAVRKPFKVILLDFITGN